MRQTGTHRLDQQKLSRLGLDQTAEFNYLDTCLDKLAKDIAVVVVTKRNSISEELTNAKGRTSSLQNELEQYVSFIRLYPSLTF